jgi:hypothetical protein
MPPSNLSKIHFNIILPSAPWSSKWSPSLRFPPQKPYMHHSSPPYVLHVTPISEFISFPNNTKWFKYDRDDLCVNKSQFVPVIFEPPCTWWEIIIIIIIISSSSSSSSSSGSISSIQWSLQIVR